MKKIKDIEKYENKWVVLNERGTEVVKASNSFKDVFKILKGSKDKRVLFKVPSSNLVYSP